MSKFTCLYNRLILPIPAVKREWVQGDFHILVMYIHIHKEHPSLVPRLLLCRKTAGFLQERSLGTRLEHSSLPLLLLLKELILAVTLGNKLLILRFWVRVQPRHLGWSMVVGTCCERGCVVDWHVMGKVVRKSIPSRRGHLFLIATSCLLLVVNGWWWA